MLRVRPEGVLAALHGSAPRRLRSSGVVADRDRIHREAPQLTNAFPWHSTRLIDQAVYHNDTRCPVGEAIALTDRRPGDGGREPCADCARLLSQTLEAIWLRTPRTQ
jgi:hypothetical protein